MNEKIALITGGSRGIGAETAKLLAENKFTVCINYRSNEEAAKSVVAEIESFGGKAVAFQADVSKEAEVIDLFKRLDNLDGYLSSLINNAGILKQQCRLDQLDEDRINEIFRVNVTSAFICSREAVRRMSTKNGGLGGSIVNVSSMAAVKGSPNEYVDYAASKGAIDTLTKGLAMEVAAEGIRVNAVRPGLIYTDMHACGGEPARVDRLKEKIPMQRGGQAKEIAEAIYWLVSEKASFSTGSFIDASGGI